MRILAFFLTLLLIFSLPSCKREDFPSCRDILSAILENEIGLPAGRVYYLHSAKGDDSYLSDHLINAYTERESDLLWLTDGSISPFSFP